MRVTRRRVSIESGCHHASEFSAGVIEVDADVVALFRGLGIQYGV